MTRVINWQSPKKVIEGKPMHYVQDGSGRDTYIIDGEGGFMLNKTMGTGGPFTFENNLRQYEKSPNRRFGRSPSNDQLSRSIYATGRTVDPYPKEETDFFQNG